MVVSITLLLGITFLTIQMFVALIVLWWLLLIVAIPLKKIWSLIGGMK